MNAPTRRADLIDAVRFWFELAEHLKWRSYDPFDLLASPYLRRCWEVSPIAARVWVQIGRRSGAGVRRLLRIAPHEEAQTLATFLRSAALLTRCGETWASSYLDPLRCRLLARAIAVPGGHGWGLEFPVASRFGCRPGRIPNIYQTMLALSALLDAEELRPSEVGASFLHDGVRFITEQLAAFEYDSQWWLRYWPHSDDPIVNVQALAAGVFARSADQLGEHRLLDFADHAAEAVLSVQRPDGSWLYSADGRATFVDGFHTGFVLEGLSEYRRWRQGPLDRPTGEAVQLGFRYFQQHLLTPGAEPRAFADGPITLDGQTVAQCIQTLTVCATGPADIDLGLRAWERVNRRHGPVTAGHRSSQRSLGGADYPGMRWVIAPVALATAHLVHALNLAPAGAANRRGGPRCAQPGEHRDRAVATPLDRDQRSNGHVEAPGTADAGERGRRSADLS